MEPTDETLCERVVRRDEEAFDLLVVRYQQRAYRIAWSILRDTEEARDVSQEAFIRLYHTAGSFQGRARFSTWFYRILVNLCLDARRRRRWWQRAVDPVEREDGSWDSLIDQQSAPAVDPTEAMDREKVLARLWRAVDGLSPQQRAALLLQVQEEMATADIANVLKCSEATVRVHLHRALASLRKTMGKG